MTDANKPLETDAKHLESQADQHGETEAASHSRHWTGAMNLAEGEDISVDVIFKQLCKAFNQSPFFHHSGMQMRVEGGEIKGFVDMNPNLIGNVAFQILHGGVAATLLDSVGGIVAMGEIYRRGKGELANRIRQVSRLATADMRVDYLAPGRGKQFIGSAEVLRMGRKGCTVRMNLHNEASMLIATAIATYAY